MARPTRDPREIVTEIDATIGIRSIREWANLKDALAVRFNELVLLAAIFVFSLGLILTLVFALPQEDETIYNIWLLWTCGFVLTTVLAFEFLIRKFRVVRRIIELNLKRLDRMERQIEKLKRQMETRPGGEDDPAAK